MKKLFTALAISLAFSAAAQAQAWPSKSVTLVVPFPPGGSTDTVARAIAPKLTEKLGQPFVVDNKAGATGTIGATQVKRSAPDGYNFLVTSLGPLVIAPHLIRNMPYDTLKDFDTITVAVQAPNVLVVPARSPYKTVGALVAYQKLNPGKMSFASSGNGSSDHLTAELFWQQTGTSGTHVPYKGGAPAITDLLGGQVDASFQNINAVLQHIKSGKARALAVTSAKRLPSLPDVPTVSESGLPNFEMVSWYGIWAPANMPADLTTRLNREINTAMQSPQVVQNLGAQAFIFSNTTAPQFGAYVKQESAKYKQLIEKANIKVD